jgi:DNA polymerase-1
VKSLFIAPPGMKVFSTDASQIEYRFFGHYVNSKSVTDVYNADPWADFHQVVADMTGLARKDAKHANFAMLFGAGVNKFAYMIDKPAWEAKPIYYAYLRKIPEVRPLLDYVMDLAETRGFVKTVLGRRRRFGEGIDMKFHAGLNAAIQGSAADYNKLTVLDLYENRKDLGIDLRLTFHDEELGYGYFDNHAQAQKLYDFMQEQRMNLKVPILWNLTIDNDWAMQNPIWEMKDGKMENKL